MAGRTPIGVNLSLAEFAGKVEGFVYASSKPPNFNPFVSYVVIRRDSETRSREITKRLLKELILQAARDGADPKSVYLLHESSDPEAAKDPMERRERLARFKLFAKLAETGGLDLRVIGARCLQPDISMDSKAREIPLLLFVTRPKSTGSSWNSMPKAQIAKFIQICLSGPLRAFPLGGLHRAEGFSEGVRRSV